MAYLVLHFLLLHTIHNFMPACQSSFDKTHVVVILCIEESVNSMNSTPGFMNIRQANGGRLGNGVKSIPMAFRSDRI